MSCAREILRAYRRRRRGSYPRVIVALADRQKWCVLIQSSAGEGFDPMNGRRFESRGEALDFILAEQIGARIETEIEPRMMGAHAS